MRIFHPCRPFAHGRRYRVLERSCPFLYRDDLRAQQLHPVDIERLPQSIFLAHDEHRASGDLSWHEILFLSG